MVKCVDTVTSASQLQYDVDDDNDDDDDYDWNYLLESYCRHYLLRLIYFVDIISPFIVLLLLISTLLAVYHNAIP